MHADTVTEVRGKKMDIKCLTGRVQAEGTLILITGTEHTWGTAAGWEILGSTMGN